LHRQGAAKAEPILTKVIEMLGGSWKIGWVSVAVLSFGAGVISILFVKNKPSDLGQVPDGRSAPETTGCSGSARSTMRVYRTQYEWTSKQALRSLSFWLIFLGAVGFIVPHMLCVVHGVVHFMDKGFPKALAAASVGLLTLFSIFGRLAGGVLGDRIEPRFVWSGSLVVLLAGLFAVMGATSTVHIYLYAILVGLGFGAAYVCMVTMIGNYFGATAFASIMGVFSPAIIIVGAVSPFLAGWVFDSLGSYNPAFIGAALLCAAGCVALLAAKPGQPVGSSAVSVPGR
ncbi:MFS transporter, partial [Thermodesulfobacteriota bacterium]